MGFLLLLIKDEAGHAFHYQSRPSNSICGRAYLKLTTCGFLRFFAFDLGKPRSYNPRPRCFAAACRGAVLPVDFDVKIVGGRCLTL